jgi:starch synthase
MRILFVAAEVAPFAKVGGLADVAGALPKELCALGHDVRVIMPRHGSIDGTRYGLRPALDSSVDVLGSPESARLEVAGAGPVPVYFVANERYFSRDNVYAYEDDIERFLYFCRAALDSIEALGWAPDVVHVNDWHTAVIPHWMRHGYEIPASLRSAVSLITIHNLAYRGELDPKLYPTEWMRPNTLEARTDASYDLLAQGIASADLVTTVSERYAHEITLPEHGEGLDELLRERSNELRGIINGIDYEVFDPANDPAIAEPYSAESLDGKAACKAALQREAGFDVGPRTPLIGIVGRLADQKGFDLVAQLVEPLLAEVDVQIVMLGTGDPAYHNLFRELAAHNRRQLAVYLKFDAALAQRIYAGSDMFLMPSRFEPCGLGQLISLRYGTVPVVRLTGGLADTVTDYQPATRRGTGFVFREYQPVALTLALGRALETYREMDRWREIQLQGMKQDVSWKGSAKKYVDVYQRAVDRGGRA